MITKTVIMLMMYFAPLVLLCCGIFSSPLIILAFYVLSGLGMAGIGMGVMHDANHGSYTSKSFFGFILSHTLDLMGCSSQIWKLQHNVLHHTYTNIHGHDEDINAPLLLRFSPYTKLYKIQRYQHYYVWIFYSLLTIHWVTGKDFISAFRYKKLGLIKPGKEFILILLKLFITKLFYFGYALVLPMLFSPSIGWTIAGFFIMHGVASLLLSTVFQLAHVMPDMSFPQPEDDQIDDNWFTHQLSSTSNFAPKNRFLFWYFGGLTNQIEHHLFPNICHVHYRNLGRIVSKTAREYEIPYHVNKSFFSAVGGHIKMLRSLGRKND